MLTRAKKQSVRNGEPMHLEMEQISNVGRRLGRSKHCGRIAKNQTVDGTSDAGPKM